MFIPSINKKRSLLTGSSNPINLNTSSQPVLQSISIVDLARSNNYFNFETPSINEYNDRIEKTDEIRKSYSTDLDLLFIHRTIRNNFIYGLNEIKRVDNEIYKLQNKLNLYNNTLLMQKHFLKQIESLTLEKNSYSLNVWNEYVNRSRSILEKYSELTSNKKNIIGKQCIEDDDILEIRFNLIDSYLEIVKDMKLLYLEIVRVEDLRAKCKGCLKIISENNDEESGINKCSCGVITEILKSNYFYRDATTVSDSSVDKIVEQLSEWLDNYIGNPKVVPPATIFNDMDVWCSKNGYVTSNYIKENNAPNYYNHDTLLLIMKESGYSKWNDCKNYIRNKYWGWELPVLTIEQRNKFLQDVAKSQPNYEQIKGRKSNIQKDARGYLHLISVGHNCNIKDFHIPTSSVDYINNSWKQMVELTPGLKHCTISC